MEEPQAPSRQDESTVDGITRAGRPATLGIPPAKEGPLQILQFNPVGATSNDLSEAAEEIVQYHACDEDQRNRLRALERAGAVFLRVIATCAPPGPERSTAISRAREAKMWGAAAIALEPKP